MTWERPRAGRTVVEELEAAATEEKRAGGAAAVTAANGLDLLCDDWGFSVCSSAAPLAPHLVEELGEVVGEELAGAVAAADPLCDDWGICSASPPLAPSEQLGSPGLRGYDCESLPLL